MLLLAFVALILRIAERVLELQQGIFDIFEAFWRLFVLVLGCAYGWHFDDRPSSIIRE